MPRDALIALRATLDHGPGHCPPDLFAGDARRVLAGLKAHANTIAHARHVALEDTYPRTRELIGPELFHALAERHLHEAETLRRSLATIGAGFHALLDGEARDLARLEWAWLQAHGAPDAQAFDLAALAGRSPEAIAAAIVTTHPAAHLLPIAPQTAWDDVEFDGFALVVRPEADVAVHAVDGATARLFASLTTPTLFAAMLEGDADAAIRLVTLGALTEDFDR